MKVALEKGDVGQETLSSRGDRSSELMRGYESPLTCERGKRWRGGKNSKERAAWDFFVTASDEKDAPIVGSRNPRCFKS